MFNKTTFGGTPMKWGLQKLCRSRGWAEIGLALFLLLPFFGASCSTGNREFRRLWDASPDGATHRRELTAELGEAGRVLEEGEIARLHYKIRQRGGRYEGMVFIFDDAGMLKKKSIFVGHHSRGDL